MVPSLMDAHLYKTNMDGSYIYYRGVGAGGVRARGGRAEVGRSGGGRVGGGRAGGEQVRRRRRRMMNRTKNEEIFKINTITYLLSVAK